MERDPASTSVAGDLPESVREWLTDLADDTEFSQEELVARLVSGADGISTEAEPLAQIQARLAELETVIEETDSILRSRIADVEDEFDEKIDDVRERVIQVKRETDSRAHEDHSHRDLQADIEALEADVASLQDSLDEFGSRIESTVETIQRDHEDLTDQMDEIRRKLDILANALLELRRETTEVSDLGSRLAAVTNLADAANRNGVTEAKCENCRAPVDISLLTRPRCPHCQEPFNDFEPKGWFLGSHTLKTGTRPALEGEVADDSGLAEIADSGPTEAAPRSGRSAEAHSPTDTDQEPADGLQAIDGIGAAYADRLQTAGVSTVAELATADPDDLAGAIDVSSKLTRRWVNQAREAVGSG